MRESRSDIPGMKTTSSFQLMPERKSASTLLQTQDAASAFFRTGREIPEVHGQALKRISQGGPMQARRAVLQMQRSYGNRYVQRVLAINRQEQGADSVTPNVEEDIERSRSGGQALDPDTRGKMESVFGTD